MLHHNQKQLIVHFLPFSSFWDISFPCLSLSDNIVDIYKKEKTFKKSSINSHPFQLETLIILLILFMILNNCKSFIRACISSRKSEDLMQPRFRRSCCVH